MWINDGAKKKWWKTVTELGGERALGKVVWEKHGKKCGECWS